MILEFSICNFFSFCNKVTFSMLANTNKGLDDNYICLDNKKILKSAAIYGANASGKSNLFKVLNLVVRNLQYSNMRDVNSKILINPFIFNESVNKPSEFEIKFITNNIRYVYGFKADTDKIYEEYLYYYPNGRETKIFDRTNINEYSFPQKDEKILKDIANKNTPNKFFLATATTWNYEKTKNAYNFLTKDLIIVNNILELKDIALKEYVDKKDLKDIALDFLKEADFNIIDYKIVKLDIPDLMVVDESSVDKVNFYQVLIKHRGSDQYISLDKESMGTQIIFLFIPFISDVLNKEKVLLVDELDRSIHPYLVEYIVSLFNNKDKNINGSQLIFNTHDTNLLNLNNLRKDQIWFTEKNNENGISDLYSLSDFNIRKESNFEKGYLLGRYGAVPFIKNDYNLWKKE